MPRIPRVTIALTLVLGTACSDAPSDAATTAAAQPVSPLGRHRWGDGRALAARLDGAADRLVVATTIGVSVQTADGSPVELHDGLTSLLAVSPDGRLAAFTTAAGRLEIVDLATARAVAGYDVDAERYTSLAFASPTDVIAGGEVDVTRYGVDGGTPEPLVEAPAGGALGPVALNAADGAVAVPVGGVRPVVAVWTASAGVTTVDLGLPEGTALVGVVWAEDGRHLAVLHQPPSAGETIAVWDVGAAAFRGRVAIPNYVLPEQVAFQGGDRLAVPLADRLAAFDLDGTELESLPITSSEASRLAAVSGSPAVVITGWDGRVRRWMAGEAAEEWAPATRRVVDQSIGAGELVTVDHVGMIRRYDLASGEEVGAVDRYAVGEANSVAVAPDGATVAMGMSTGAVRVLRTTDGTPLAAFDRPEGNVAAVAYAPVAPLLAAGVSVQVGEEVWDDTVAVTDVTSGRTVAALGGEGENVTGCSFFQSAVEFSPDGALLAATSHDFTVHVTRLDGGDVEVLDPHAGTVLDVEFSPDGALLATSSEDGTLRIWDVEAMSLRDELPAAAGGYWALAFTPDGSALAVSDVAGAISLLDASTGETIRTFTGTKSQLGDMEFTPDGGRLVAGAPDGAVDVWSVDGGMVVERLTGHTLAVTDVAVTADGSTVVSSSLDGTVRTWPL